MPNMNDRGAALCAEFAESYMEKLFYFCLKKTGDSLEAEDLTQDIALNILSALNRGTIPESLLKNESFKEFTNSYSSFERGIVLEQALADGWIKYDENTSRAIGAYMYI